MKHTVAIILFFVLATIFQTAMAYRHSSFGSSRAYHGYSRSYGGIHAVRTYTRRNGTVVQRHLSGNPGSGIHCHYTVCR